MQLERSRFNADTCFGAGRNVRQDGIIFMFSVGQEWMIWSSGRERESYRNQSSRKYREKGRRPSAACFPLSPYFINPISSTQ